MIGGGGPKVLSVAARQADIVQVLPATPRGTPDEHHPLTSEAMQQQVDLVRDAAGDRFDDIELATLLMNVTITDDADPVLDDLLVGFASSSEGDVRRPHLSRDALVSAPLVAVGTLEQVCEKLLAVRETLGFSYFVSPVGARPEVLGPVIDRLAVIS
jgi:alkanesulfonate monooxygenase SsuD/methylene tetrahydromethanopterin reductase-like flavin-dependent oxidoreductase (luciferase family)